MLVHVTCMLACLVVQMSCTEHLITHMFVACVLVTHMLVTCVHSSCMPWLHIRRSSMCIIICHCYNNPTTAPRGDPSMARLPWGLMKHAIWYVCGPWSHAPYNLLIAMARLLTIP